MIFYTANELLISCALSLLFGALCGIIYPSLSLIFYWSLNILTVEFRVIKSKNFILCKGIDRSPSVTHRISAELYDFLFFSFCGILFCILCYITSDGHFRLYMLVLSVSAFFLFKNTLGVTFKSIIYLLLNFLYRAWMILISILNAPIKFLFIILLKLIRPPYEKAKQLIYHNRRRTMISKKIKQLTYIFENIH